MDRSFLFHYTALGVTSIGLGMFFVDIYTLNNGAILFGENFQYLRYLAFIVSGNNLYCIPFFNVHFHYTIDYFLQHFGGKRNYFHKLFFSKLSSNWSKNTGATKFIRSSEQDTCIVIKADIRAIVATNLFFCAYDNSLGHTPFLNTTRRDSILDSYYNSISNRSISLFCATENTDTQSTFCSTVISDRHSSFLLYHLFSFFFL